MATVKVRAHLSTVASGLYATVICCPTLGSTGRVYSTCRWSARRLRSAAAYRRPKPTFKYGQICKEIDTTSLRTL